MNYTKKLTRSNDGMLAGVLKGVADCYGYDPTIVRLLFVLISLFSAAFPGILVYVILWVIIPKES